ncbi:MAG: beta-ketoacyl synthase chain length factor [Brachymonas sp.]|nr:beta-ketoacyl synthase chain length factor [Brachymonas sp.]
MNTSQNMNKMTATAHASRPLRVRLHGVGVLGPGLENWAQCRACLRGEAAYQSAATVLPAPDMLPPAERRRASRVIKLALAIGAEAVQHAAADAARLASVFSSSTGDGQNCHALCETLVSPQRDISPTRFHNSVHNTAAGYWCIATGATGPCQVLAAYDASFAAGLLEAAVQVHAEQRDVLLLAYDSDYPEPLKTCRPVPDAAGVALLLRPATEPADAQALAELAVTWCAGAPPVASSVTQPALDAGLQALSDTIPAMRALPLLQLLAREQAGQVWVAGLPGQGLQIGVQPCA